MRSKKSTRFMRFTGFKGFMRSRRFADFRRLTGKHRPQVIGLLVLCMAAAAMLIAARQPSPSADVTAVEPQPEHIAATQPAPSVAVQPTSKKAPAVQARPTKTTASVAPTPSTSALPARTLAADTTATKTSGVELVPSKVPVRSNEPVPSKAVVQESAAVTITGCLERDDETFRLRDTSGEDAPKSRSWKSGFLRKRSATIELVDAANRAKLMDHVGERVSVTGMLEDREMHVRSLQRVATSCTKA